MQLVVMNGYSSKWLLFILSTNEVNKSIDLVIMDFGVVYFQEDGELLKNPFRF
jgi:hypothetical protein